VHGLLSGLGEDVSGINDFLEDLGVGGLDVGKEGGLEGLDLVDVDAVAVSLDTDEEGGDDLLWLVWLVLALLEELVQTDSTVELLLGGGIKVGTELGEGSDLTVLGELELHGTGDGLSGLVLGGGSDTGHGETDRDGWALSLVEELGLQKDLSISDGDHVGWDVGGHISGLGLDDWKGGERTSSVGAVHLGGTLQETGVEVEDITWVGFAAGWATEEEGHLTVGDGLLGQVIVEDHGMLAVVAEELSHGGSGVWGEELEWGGVGSGGGDDDAVVHGATLIELSDELGDGGSLLSDTDVDAGKRLLLGLLVDDGVNGDGGLSGLTITDDKLTLSTSDWDEGVDGLESGKHWLGDGLSWDDAWGLGLSTGALAGVEGGSFVDWLTDTVNDASEELLTDWDVDDGSGTLDGVTLKDVTIISEDDNSDVVLLQVQGHTAETAGKDNHLSGLDVGESVDTGDTISDGDDGSGLGVLDGGVLGSGDGTDLALKEAGELEGLAGHASGGGEGSAAGGLCGGGKSHTLGNGGDSGSECHG